MNREIKFRQFCDEEENHQYGMHYVDPYQQYLIKDGTWHTMQFTGLKDKNGKEIYEGDVVKDWEYIDTYKVVWNRKWACFELERITHANDTEQEIDNAQFDLEVIGNIYENPELLKV